MYCLTPWRGQPAQRWARSIAVAGAFAAVAAVSARPALAAAVLNGTFTSTTGTFGTFGGGLNTLKSDTVTADYTAGGGIANWTVVDVGTAQGLGFLYNTGNQSSPNNQGNLTTNGDGVVLTGRFGNFSVYDPGNVAGTGGVIPNTVHGGGNFLAVDGAVGYQLAIYQTLTSLTKGQMYAVSFWYAAGQQYSFTGTTTEGWQVTLGSTAQLTQLSSPDGITTQVTPTQAGGGLAQGGFQGWAQEVFNFTAGDTTQVLTFLSLGTPSGQPPVDFLTDVSIAPVPEPGSLSILMAGLVSFTAVVRVRRRP